MIFVTNDDGFTEELCFLANCSKSIGKTIIICPDQPRSAYGHKLSLNQEIYLTERSDDIWECSGTTVDCVLLSIELFGKPDIFLTGINKDLNIGSDVHYSSTVAGAVEASLNSCKSIAFSAINNHFQRNKNNEKYIIKLINDVLNSKIDPNKICFNINLPSICSNKIIIKQDLSSKLYLPNIERKKENKSKEGKRICCFYFNEGRIDKQNEDYKLIEDGYILINPLFVKNSY